MRQDVREKLIKEYDIRRQRALTEAAARRQRIYEACPILWEIDGQMATLSKDAALQQLNGDDTAMERMGAQIATLSQRKNKLLASVGASPQDLQPKYQCEECKDTGRTDSGWCRCFINRMLAENLQAANLVKQASHQTFDNFDLQKYDTAVHEKYGISSRAQMKKVFEKCRAFAADMESAGNLLLMGAPGLGKTFLSSAIANEVLAKGYTVAYASSAQFFDNYTRTRFSDQPMAMEPYYTCDLLILDDLGTEFRTQMTVSLLGEIIDRRLRDGKHTILSTNFTFEEMEQAYHERVVSRLMGGYTYLLFFGKDIRAAGTQQ